MSPVRVPLNFILSCLEATVLRLSCIPIECKHLFNILNKANNLPQFIHTVDTFIWDRSHVCYHSYSYISAHGDILPCTYLFFQPVILFGVIFILHLIFTGVLSVVQKLRP